LGSGADDSDNNGIGDIPYQNNGVSDQLPIWDDFAPIINIIFPDNNSKHDRDSPVFNIQIDDFYPEEIWYSFDSGITNYTFTSNGSLDASAWQAVWDSLPEGAQINITFYANDTMSRVSSEQITLIKEVPAGIPGFNIFLLCGISLVGVYIAIKSSKHNLKPKP
jgi:hypothetical protein